MKDLSELARSVRAWGWVAMVFGLVPATFLLLGVAGGESGTSEVVYLGVPFAVLTILGMLMVNAGGRLARARAEGRNAGRPPGAFGRPGLMVLTLTGLMVLFSGLNMPMCACGGPRERAYEAAAKSDLRNLKFWQELYYSEHHVYTAARAELGDFTWSEGVSVAMRAEDQGWTARATHLGFPDPDASCVIYVGEVEPFHTLTGIEPPEEGQPFCDPDY